MMVKHKYAVLEGRMVCGFQPKERGWKDCYDTFWDRVTCPQCLAQKEQP